MVAPLEPEALDDRPAPLDLLLRAVLDGIDDAVVVVASSDRRVRFTNASGRDLLAGASVLTGPPPGWQATEMRGDGLIALVLRPARSRSAAPTDRSADDARDEAMHDAATGLIARPLLVDRLAHAAARSQRAGGSLAVLVAHLDGLDTLDDALRDHAAAILAGRLLAAVRDGDTVARIEVGDFVVLLEDVSAGRIAGEVGGRLLNSLAQPIGLPGSRSEQIELGVSIGAAIHDGVAGVGQLMIAADAAADQARRSATGEVVIVGGPGAPR